MRSLCPVCITDGLYLTLSVLGSPSRVQEKESTNQVAWHRSAIMAKLSALIRISRHAVLSAEDEFVITGKTKSSKVREDPLLIFRSRSRVWLLTW